MFDSSLGRNVTYDDAKADERKYCPRGTAKTVNKNEIPPTVLAIHNAKERGPKPKFKPKTGTAQKKVDPPRRNKKENKGGESCDFCGRRNHVERDCIFAKRFAQRKAKPSTSVNTVQADRPGSPTTLFCVGDNMCGCDNEGRYNFVLDSGAKISITQRSRQ